MSSTTDPLEPARCLEAAGPDPDQPCYAHHRAWSERLAAGYASSTGRLRRGGHRGVLLSLEEAEQLRAATIVVPAGQLAQWVLEDLEQESSDAHG